MLMLLILLENLFRPFRMCVVTIGPCAVAAISAGYGKRVHLRHTVAPLHNHCGQKTAVLDSSLKPVQYKQFTEPKEGASPDLKSFVSVVKRLSVVQSAVTGKAGASGA